MVLEAWKQYNGNGSYTLCRQLCLYEWIILFVKSSSSWTLLERRRTLGSAVREDPAGDLFICVEAGQRNSMTEAFSSLRIWCTCHCEADR